VPDCVDEAGGKDRLPLRLTPYQRVHWQMEPVTSKQKGELTPYLIILLLCSVILGGAAILKPSTPEAPSLQVGRITLPNVCIFRATTGLPCPGCGLTRSIVAAAHGHMAASISHHRLGLLTLIYVILQFVFNLSYISISKWRGSLYRYIKLLHKGMIILAVLFFLNWILTLTLIFT
jgi:hypothetical protein